MEKRKKHHLPRGAQRAGGEKARSVGKVKSALCIVLMMLGIFIGLSVQTIRSEAAASSQNDDGIPKEIKEYCEEIGEEFGICPELLEAIAWHESRFIPTVKNKNCWGLCQVNVKIHAERIMKYDYTSEDMLTSYANIKVAADYLAELYETYGDDNPIVLSLYAGMGWKAVEEYKEYGFLTPIVDDILTRSERYERLHGK